MSDENDTKSKLDESAPGDKHALKKGIRENAAKAWGMAVEAGALLSGESGQIVDAERDVAEADGEDLLDRLDGEG